MIALLFVIAITVATVGLGIWATGKSKSTSDFFVASRSVGVGLNAAAISGEYLSAASFMGIAGLVMKNGYDSLWYPVGYAAGYLFLLLFIAGPLRRFGAYTIPDFAEGRFDSSSFRKIAVTFVLFIGFFYTMPQMKGAGVTMASIMNWPYWMGIAVVGTVITFNVVLGGMKGITLVQAFQYWAKVFAISVPCFVLMAVFQVGTPHAASENNARLKSDGAIKVKGATAYPANVVTMPSEPSWLYFPKGAKIGKIELSRKLLPTEPKLTVGQLIENAPKVVLKGPIRDAKGKEVKANYHDLSQLVRGDKAEIPENTALLVYDGKPEETGVKTPVSLKFQFAEATEFRIWSAARWDGAGGTHGQVEAIAPNAPPDAKWLNPFGPLTSKWGYPVLYTYSLIIALVCGTAGLPHILVRFYTNPDGRAAKRTTLWVMVMLGGFYVFTPIWGALGRALMPALYASNATDSVVIKVPTILSDPLMGQIFSGVTSAGAFAAFMSTFSGLLVSMSGAFAHDIYGKILKPSASPESRLVAFKLAAVGVGVVSMLLGLFVETFDIAMMVGWAFAIGAASYFPLLLLGAWWRGLTKTGAAAGMLLGGLASLTAIIGSMLLDKKVIAADLPPLLRALMEQPAIWGVPLSLVTMYVVSRATAKEIPADVNLKMLRLHAPEELGLSKNYIEG